MKKVVGKLLEREKINKDIYLKKTANGDIQSYTLHNTRFSDNLFKICLLSYINKSINYKSISIKNSRKKLNQREKLILNATYDEFDEELINTIPNTNSDYVYEGDINDNVIDFQEIVTNRKILHAISILTNRQKEILYMFYVLELSDKEIADKLSITIQAINRTRNTALRKIKKSIGGDKDGIIYSNSI